MKIPSPTMKQSVGDRHMINISPTRHKSRSPKIARRRKSSSGRWLMSWMNKEEEEVVVVDMDTHHPPHPALFDIMTHSTSSNVNTTTTTTTSPYYKGLTDQSLAILDQISSSSSSSSVVPPSIRPHPHPHPLLLSSGYSPYYKGLTDFSLVVDAAASSNWTPSHPHPHPHHNHNSSSTLSTSTSSSSPYYRGLIDYSLALALHPPPPNSSSSLCPVKEKLTPQPTDDQEDKPPMETDQPEAEGKPLSVSVNNESEATLSLEEEEMELVTTQDDDDVVVVEGKPLSVNNESEAIQVETVHVFEQNVEKTISDHHVEENKEKPLRETRVSDLEVETTILPENNADKTDLDLEEMELVIDQEKPLSLTLREVENVVVLQEEQITEKTDLELEVRDCGEKAASEQTVALELPCEDDEHKLKLKEMADDDDEEGKVYQYLWATKYQPKTLEEFICNRDKALQLKALVKEGCGCNHFIFEGPPNVGKRSMIRAMLREVFGADRVQVTEEYEYFNLKGEMVDNLQLRILKSLHHVEVNLSETKGYEKHVIVDLFKETYGKVINTTSLPCIPENCQAIVLYEAEKLSLETLLYIKWLLEKYKGCSKVFFCCSDESRLQAIKSICTTVRLSSPSSEEIFKILEYIGKEEGIKLSTDTVKKIILRSSNNLRQAIRSLEATCRHKDILNNDDLILTGWEDDILNIAKNIIEEQSPRQLYVIRRKLQSLMAHDVPPDLVYKSLVAELMSLVDDSLRSGLAKLDKEYSKGGEIKFENLKQFGYAQNKQGGPDEKNNEPSKKNAMNYLKVEEFIAKFMSWYKNSSKSNNHVQLTAGT